MTSIYGIFPYPDDTPQTVLNRFFDDLKEVDKIVETVDNRRVASAENENISFNVEISCPDNPTPIAVNNLSCLVLQRSKGGVLMDETDRKEPKRDKYVDLLLTIYQHLPERPATGYVMDVDQSGGITHDTALYFQPVTTETLANNRFYDAAWTMFFPPVMVETYGRETLLDLPARRIDELEDGTIVVVSDGDPTTHTEFRKIADALDLPAAEERPY